MPPVYLSAVNRYDLSTLIQVRRALETGADVLVAFADGSPAVTFTPADLHAVRQKIMYSM